MDKKLLKLPRGIKIRFITPKGHVVTLKKVKLRDEKHPLWINNHVCYGTKQIPDTYEIL